MVRGGGTLVIPSSNSLMFGGKSLESLLKIASANESQVLWEPEIEITCVLLPDARME